MMNKGGSMHDVAQMYSENVGFAQNLGSMYYNGHTSRNAQKKFTNMAERRS